MSATGATIRTIDLDDLAAGVDEETSQAGAVTRQLRPSTPNVVVGLNVCAHLSNCAYPRVLRHDLETAQHAPERVERGGDVKVCVGVDSHDKTRSVLCAILTPVILVLVMRGMRLVRQRAGGRTVLGRASCTGSYQVTFAPLIAPNKGLPGHERRIIRKAMRRYLEGSVPDWEILADIIPVS